MIGLIELELTEGRSTGIPKMLRTMAENGSPVPEFETDEDRSYNLVRLPVHADADWQDLAENQIEKPDTPRVEGTSEDQVEGPSRDQVEGLSRDQVSTGQADRTGDPVSDPVKAPVEARAEEPSMGLVSTGQATGQADRTSGPVNDPATDPVEAPSRHQVAILRKCLKESHLVEFLKAVNRSDRTKFRHQVLNPLLDEELVEMTQPDSPNSPTQKYRLTAKGRQLLETL